MVEGVVAVEDDVDGHAGPAETGPQRHGQLDVVFDHQHPHGHSSYHVGCPDGGRLEGGVHPSRMPDPMLQKHTCVASLQHRQAYNVVLGLIANEYCDGPVASARRATDPRRGARVRRAGLVVATLLGRQ